MAMAFGSVIYLEYLIFTGLNRVRMPLALPGMAVLISMMFTVVMGLFQCLSELSEIILRTQAEGDLAFAEQFEQKYAGIPKYYSEDKQMMSLENIPIDVVFDFQK